MSEQYKTPQHNQPKSSRAVKKLMTAIVVAILIAVFSLLTWQLYHLLTARIFQ
jgi:cytochrome oxidase assembly protein ShyY1